MRTICVVLGAGLVVMACDNFETESPFYQPGRVPGKAHAAGSSGADSAAGSPSIDNDAGPSTDSDSGSLSTDQAGSGSTQARTRGDLTDYYQLHVDVLSDTCLPTRAAADREVLLFGDRARGLLTLPIPGQTSNRYEIPFQLHALSPRFPKCPDVELAIETGPVELSEHRIVVPWTESWQNLASCPIGQLQSEIWKQPALDCETRLQLTYEWSRACPTAPKSAPDPSIGATVYCD